MTQFTNVSYSGSYGGSGSGTDVGRGRRMDFPIAFLIASDGTLYRTGRGD